MKRYRILGFDFDSRARLLEITPDESDESVNAFHRVNRERIIEGLRQQYGVQGFDQKLRNFQDLGAKPFSVVAFHNRFYSQVRDAYVAGYYYAALTGVVALGERVLNHLILGLRDHYKSSEIYKHIYRKHSFDNWELALKALHEWNVLKPEVEEYFLQLSVLRNEALHFNFETDIDDREQALQALRLFGQIVEAQFSCFGSNDWLFISPGEVYLRKDWESSPFIQLVYIPNAVKVGYRHKIVSALPWRIEDNDEYESKEVTDAEFAELRLNHQNVV